MQNKSWELAKQIFDSALKRSPAEREKFLFEVCAEDSELYDQVKVLLLSYESGFLEQPTINEFTQTIVEKQEKFKSGQKYGHYKIVEVLGSGGMGEVFLAEDSKLERLVALKVLAGNFARSDEYVRRFIQEAKAASALNHPNIVTIYEAGEFDQIRFIASEYIKGETLRQLIRRKEALATPEIIEIAGQIAAALNAAHEAGIVHRDIKPENIIIRKDNLVKVLDFGLAKLIEKKLQTFDAKTETYAPVQTIAGMVLGTVNYMSPEQARGVGTDARTDIWSLGIVLYELITKKTPFRGETASDVIAAILTSEVLPLNHSAPDVSPELERIVQKALRKNREERYQSAKDLLVDLKNLQHQFRFESEFDSARTIADEQSDGKLIASNNKNQQNDRAISFNPPVNLKQTLAKKAVWQIIAVIALVGGLIAWQWRQGQKRSETVLPQALSVSQIASWKSEPGGISSSQARFSPDGKLIAFTSLRAGNSAIWLAQIGGEPFTRKQDKWDDRNPIFSPDGQQIAFLSVRDGQEGIWTMPTFGGVPTLIKTFNQRIQNLIAWSKSGTTIFFEYQRNLYTLDLATKQTTQLTQFDSLHFIERSFSISPDEKSFAYVDKQNEQFDIWVASTQSGSARQVTNDKYKNEYPVWHPDGRRILYSSDRNGINQICLAYLDNRPPVQITFSDSDSFVTDVSSDGTKILYRSVKDESDLWRVQLENKKEIQITSDVGSKFWPSIDSFNEKLAFQSVKQLKAGAKLLNGAIFARSFDSKDQSFQITEDGFMPRWSPDGKRLAFLRISNKLSNLWTTYPSGGEAKQLTSEGVIFGGYTFLPLNTFQTQDYQWSPDSRSLIYCAQRNGVPNVWQKSIDDSGEKQLTDNSDQTLLFFNPIISPNNQRIAWLAMRRPRDDQKKTWAIMIHDANGTSTIYESESVLRLIGWSATGRELIVSSVAESNDVPVATAAINLTQITLQNKSLRLLAQLKAAYLLNIQLSPDKQLIAFVARSDEVDNIQIIPVGGGASRSAAESNDQRIYLASLAWSPDNKSIFYSKQTNWQIISLINNFK